MILWPICKSDRPPSGEDEAVENWLAPKGAHGYPFPQLPPPPSLDVLTSFDKAMTWVGLTILSAPPGGRG